MNTTITDPRDVPRDTKLDHGLDPEEKRFASRREGNQLITFIFALTPELVVPADVKSLKAAEEKLTQSSWADRTEWNELLAFMPGEKPAGDSSGSTRGITLGGSTSIAEVRNKGFFNLQAAFERGLKTEFEATKDAEREILDAAQTAAKEALAFILPTQAYLFIPVDELFAAQQQAEKMARDFAKECINAQKIPDKDSMKKGGASAEMKTSLGTKLRSLSMRHDGRMHIHPFSGRYAPETGIATVAAIESRQQSISGDHGRAQMGTR